MATGAELADAESAERLHLCVPEKAVVKWVIKCSVAVAAIHNPLVGEKGSHNQTGSHQMGAMSVIRQPGILGQTVHQRIIGITAAGVAGALEVVAVGWWFLLVAGGTRTTAGALFGLALLLGGSLCRVGVFGLATDNTGELFRPERVLTALILAGCWLLWLLIAELIGGILGVLLAGSILAGTLTLQLLIERWVVRYSSELGVDSSAGTGAGADVRGLSSFVLDLESALVASGLGAIGGTVLLFVTWFANVVFFRLPLVFGSWTPVLEFGTGMLAFGVFAVCVFFGHQYRFQRIVLD